MQLLLSSTYLGPIEYYSRLLLHSSILIERFEYFPKQTFRNRCHIYGANGLLSLSIPLKKNKEKTIIKDIQIAPDNNWQKIHWKSIESAYRCSPYFEFYEQDFAPHYFKKFNFLLDFNEILQNTVLNLLNAKVKISYTENYLKENPSVEDYRSRISPKLKNLSDENYITKPYVQVFQNKHGFIPNLSIIDLLFNQGPQTNLIPLGMQSR